MQIDKPTYESLQQKVSSLEKICGERNLIYKALRQNEKKYRNLTECINRGVALVQDGFIKEVNRRFLSMGGYSLDEIFGHPWNQFIQPTQADAVTKPLFEYRWPTSDIVESYKGQLQHKKGHSIAVEINKTPLSHQENQTILYIISDISDRLKIESQLLNARKLESIAALSGGIAHDYNNLLAVIIGNISLVQSLTPEDKVQSLLHEALEASNIAKELTQRLITFSKGGSPLRKVESLANLLLSATEFTLSGSNIRCDFAIAPDLWPVMIDKTQIGQALHNIVINACEAMPDGGKIEVRAENICGHDYGKGDDKDNWVRVDIRDQGCGIPDDLLEKVFDPYFSTKEMGTQKGMGLGLSIAYSIIEHHDGHIEVASRIKTGTTFSIFLPSAEESACALPDTTPAHTGTPKQKAIRGQGHILVMDDEDLVRELVGNILTHLGYTVSFSENGDQALEQYAKRLKERRPFDAVILDLTIRGGMGGRETMTKLLDLNPEVKVIVSSGYSQDPVMADHAHFGFKGVVVKPYDMYALSKVLHDVLNPA